MTESQLKQSFAIECVKNMVRAIIDTRTNNENKNKCLNKDHHYNAGQRVKKHELNEC